ncbi:hypothetical protein ACUOFC_66620, partial [Escherichia sp. TWPC-MK]
ASLIPNIAAGLHVPAVVMIMPMHFATTLARAVSPITAVVVVTSGIAGVSPFAVVKQYKNRPPGPVFVLLHNA